MDGLHRTDDSERGKKHRGGKITSVIRSRGHTGSSVCDRYADLEGTTAKSAHKL